MVFNSVLMVDVANLSADFWQFIGCISNTERLSSDQILYLLFCFPFQQIRRFSLCLWTFFCLPLPNPFLSGLESDVYYSHMLLLE